MATKLWLATSMPYITTDSNRSLGRAKAHSLTKGYAIKTQMAFLQSIR